MNNISIRLANVDLVCVYYIPTYIYEYDYFQLVDAEIHTTKSAAHV